jgi:hypothetical protein
MEQLLQLEILAQMEQAVQRAQLEILAQTEQVAQLGIQA